MDRQEITEQTQKLITRTVRVNSKAKLILKSSTEILDALTELDYKYLYAEYVDEIDASQLDGMSEKIKKLECLFDH